MHVDSLLAHAGCGADTETGDLVNPIHISTTFERDSDGSYGKDYMYSRLGNPTRHELEQILTNLEGGDSCFTFASGMAAACAILQSVEAGSTVLLPHDVFHGIPKAILNTPGLSVDTRFVDYRDHRDLDDAIARKPRLVWVETPSNPMLRVTDVRMVAEKAHSVGARVVVDGTWTTPLIQRPLELGADVVFHSITKYLSGHADVLGGAVICRAGSELGQRLEQIQQLGGSVLDPFSCWLTMRSLRTLPVRLKRHCDNADAIAGVLVKHPRVSVVHFPGLPDHSGNSFIGSQMSRGGAMISFQVGELESDPAPAMKVAAATRLIRRATSLGSTESLIEHRASMEGSVTMTPQNLLRLSVGLEDPEDLIADLLQALS
ncbi:MAG: PLP-dependent transferase [Rhodothermales bacterium]|nr:PLP-dependent transferase [Rhodothermales bacterium]